MTKNMNTFAFRICVVLSGTMCWFGCSGNKTEKVDVALKDVVGLYTGKFLNICESIKLNEDASFVHKVSYDSVCLLVETNRYTIQDSVLEFRYFTVFVHYNDVDRQTCSTNGHEFVDLSMYLGLSKQGNVVSFYPWPEYNFYYSRGGAGGEAE